jgi:hypothetical protein
MTTKAASSQQRGGRSQQRRRLEPPTVQAHSSSSDNPSVEATITENLSVEATSVEAPVGEVTSTKVTSVEAPSGENTSVEAPSGENTSVKAPSTQAITGEATSAQAPSNEVASNTATLPKPPSPKEVPTKSSTDPTVSDPSFNQPSPAPAITTVSDPSQLKHLANKVNEADPSSLKPPAKEAIDPSSLKRSPTAGWEGFLKQQVNVFKPLKGEEQLPGSLYTMPDGVRAALPVPYHKQPPYIRYTTDVGVLNWVCTACRSGCNNFLLCCDCLKPLHYDCSYIDFPSDDFKGLRDYMCKACYRKIPGKLLNLAFTENVTFTVYF